MKVKKNTKVVLYLLQKLLTNKVRSQTYYVFYCVVVPHLVITAPHSRAGIGVGRLMGSLESDNICRLLVGSEYRREEGSIVRNCKNLNILPFA